MYGTVCATFVYLILPKKQTNKGRSKTECSRVIDRKKIAKRARYLFSGAGINSAPTDIEKPALNTAPIGALCLNMAPIEQKLSIFGFANDRHC
jgi:hypothetical protein